MVSAELARAAGKLITGKVCGYGLDQPTEQALSDGIFSGVTLFKDNARDLNQLFDLVAQLRALGGSDFIVAVDQEGGAVQRFDHILTPIPSAMALAALHHDGRVYDLMQTAAEQLHLLGINCNLTPVLDVNSNPRNPIIGTRSFGDRVDRIAHLAEIVAKAHKRNNVLPVGKHFPGHGDTSEDSHLALAVDHADLKTLSDRELKPFAECVRALPAMLVGHVWLPAYDPQPLPASLSFTVSTELLRNQLHFDGYLFTDDLPVMKAIVDHYGLEEASIMAVNAGADNLLVSGSIEQIVAVHQALVAAVESGRIAQSRLQQAIRRRQSALASVSGTLVYKKEARQHLIESIAAAEHISLQTSIAAVALLRGDAPKLGSDPDDWLVVVPEHPRYRLQLAAAINSELGPGGLHVDEIRYPLDPGYADIEEIAGRVQDKNCIFVTFRALLNERQLALGEALAKVAREKVAVAVDVPYELSLMPEWHNALATFDPSDSAIKALGKIFVEGIRPRGRSPVDLAVPPISG